MKKFLKWVNTNKGAIITVILALVSISDAIFNWLLGENTIYVLGINLPAFIGIIASVLVGVLTHGFTGAALQDAINKVKEEFKEDKAKGLSYQERVAIGRKINELYKEKKELTKEYKAIIEEVEVYQLRLPSDPEYVAYGTKVQQIDAKITALNSRLGA